MLLEPQKQETLIEHHPLRLYNNVVFHLEEKTMAKKVKVNQDVCIGCGLCVGSVPSVFEFGDDGKATATAGPVTDEAAVDDAIANCPVGAISEDK